jgi:hypothetical protein
MYFSNIVSVASARLQVGNLGHEDGGPADRFEVEDVLRRHDGALVNQPPEAGRMNPAGTFWGDFQTPHVFEPIK